MGKWIDVEVEVSVRKYPIDTDALAGLLVSSKRASGYTNSQIADVLGKPKTLVEHWFRTDRYFAIPDEDAWYPLKQMLGIRTDEFDKAVTTFEFRGGLLRHEQQNLFRRHLPDTHGKQRQYPVFGGEMSKKISCTLKIRGGC